MRCFQAARNAASTIYKPCILLTDMRLPVVMGTRFAFCNYHTGITYGRTTTLGGQDAADPSQVVARAWSELFEDLHRAPPAIIADAAAAGLHGFGGHTLDRYPAIWVFIQEQYRYVATIGGIRIYQLIGT